MGTSLAAKTCWGITLAANFGTLPHTQDSAKFSTAQSESRSFFVPSRVHEAAWGLKKSSHMRRLQRLGEDVFSDKKKRLISCNLGEEPSRETRTPHSGYHFDGTSRRFFEGWYFKVSLPEERQSFAWMYSVEDPAAAVGPSSMDGGLLGGGRKFPGVGAQVLGANGEYLWQQDARVEPFWGSRHELELGHTFRGSTTGPGPKGPVSAEAFAAAVEEGFQVTPTFHQGCLRDNGRSPHLATAGSIRWEYTTQPIYGWGSQGEVQRATAGWLAALPVFEPHWQICMAGGLSTGWIEWGGQRYEFQHAPSYAEKNWGGSFPEKWFWIQCNVFEGVKGEMALTAGGGRRGLPFIPNAVEETAMVGVHYQGQFYEFVPWEGKVSWQIAPWGRWHMQATSENYEVELSATTQDKGTVLRAPTKDNGLAPLCRDTFFGQLEVAIWERSRSGGRGKLVVTARSTMPALEVGGGPWWDTWQNFHKLPEPASTVLGLPVDVASVLPPFFQPPGL